MNAQALLQSLLRCPECRRPVKLGSNATCEAGHQFEVVDGIPIFVLGDNEPAVETQHEHQRVLYQELFSADRPYVLDNWQKAYLRRLGPVLDGAGWDAPFLDSGAGGDAYTILEAARRGIPSIGCDLSLEAMRSARQYVAARGLADMCLFVVGAAEALPFADASFGACTAIAVLEHVPDDVAAIGELGRVTKPGGQVFVTVPNELERMPLPLRALYRRHDRWVGHLRHYSAADLGGKFRAVGLEPRATVYGAHWPKAFQLAIHLPLTRVRVPHDRLWWWFEKRDLDRADQPNGLHLHMVFERPALAD